jgi:hypothetical protein
MGLLLPRRLRKSTQRDCFISYRPVQPWHTRTEFLSTTISRDISFFSQVDSTGALSTGKGHNTEVSSV